MVTPWTPLSSGWCCEVLLPAHATIARPVRARMSMRMGRIWFPTVGMLDWFPLIDGLALDLTRHQFVILG